MYAHELEKACIHVYCFGTLGRRWYRRVVGMINRAQFYKKHSILVVDDSDQIRSYMKSTLALLGFEDIYLARDADMALHLCKRMPFDFILADLHLGRGRDGYQLFELLRQERLLKPTCCFIVVSAERQRHAVYGVIEFEPDDYLLKPFSYAELERRISRACHLKLALKHVYQAIHQGDFAAGVQACDAVVAENSRYAMHASRMKAELLIHLGEYQQAEQLYEWALTVREFSWARLGLAVTYGYQERKPEAERLLHELSAQAETRIEALDWLTRLYISEKKPLEALTAVEQVAKSSPRNYLRQHVLATLAGIAAQRDVAVEVHHKLLSAARFSMYDTADNMLNYARALVEQAKDLQGNELAAQIEKVKDFIFNIRRRFNPANFAHDRLVVEARLLSLQGQTQKAIELLEQSERLALDKPQTAAAVLDRARAYFDVGNLAMCDHYMGTLSSLTQGESLYNSALQLMMEHEQAKHQAMRQQLMEQNAAGMDAYGSGDFVMAIDYFRSALQSMPANVNIALNLLQALSMRKVLDKEYKALAQHCISVIDAGGVPDDQQKRYEVIRNNLDL